MPQAPAADIVVTASKQRVPLISYPGAVFVADLGDSVSQRLAARGTAAIVDQLPFVTTTSAGAGRNKLFVRGIADSSFMGPTQSTVGQYLGDVRLTYNAPDPDLNLYDMDRVEVLEGPQGTLYGAGALGGIMRLVPRAPVIGKWDSGMSGGISMVGRGGAGGDLAAMVNAPLSDFGAVRLVGYRAIVPGYIDDVQRRASNVNRSRSAGGRGAVRIIPGGGWSIDVGGIYQVLGSDDGQYSEKGAPPLSRRTALAEPSSSEYILGYAGIGKQWQDGLEFVSNLALVRRALDKRYDATFAAGGDVSAFDVLHRSNFVNAEARLSRSGAGGSGWIIGANLIINTDRSASRFSEDKTPDVIVGVTNHTRNAAVYGQATFAITGRLYGTLGSRWTFTQMSSDLVSFADDEIDFDRVGTRARYLPSAALSLRLTPQTTAYLRYQGGYRAGGVAVGQNGVSRFRPDTLQMFEAGVRFGQGRRSGLTGSAALSCARWHNIQADLNGESGLRTANIGSGRVIGLETALEWRPVDGLTLSGALFLADSGLTEPADGLENSRRDALPNIPGVTARAGIGYTFATDSRTSFSVHGSGRYVGRSWLGVGPELHLAQGRYVDTALGVEVSRGDIAVSLDVSNVLDTRGNRFAFGNPFGVARGDQETPLQPRTVRLGLRARF
ncbi:MAG: TonB-dependent receptor [Novosphingobium sp.]